MRVLIAEDDDRIALPLQQALSMCGFSADMEADGEKAWFRGDTEAFEAVILDIGLPTLDGLSVLKRWRNAGRTMPVLILTARGEWRERVEGIEAGADDYVVKPFHMEEVTARVRALVRRSGGFASSRVEFGEFSIDLRLMQVSRNGVPVALTPQEYRLLAYLVLQKGRVVSQLEITEHLYNQDVERYSNSIEVLVGRVRKRLGNDIIKTRRGFGYILGSEQD
jgi:two-component system OmpR family response regulator